MVTAASVFNSFYNDVGAAAPPHPRPPRCHATRLTPRANASQNERERPCEVSSCGQLRRFPHATAREGTRSGPLQSARRLVRAGRPSRDGVRAPTHGSARVVSQASSASTAPPLPTAWASSSRCSARRCSVGPRAAPPALLSAYSILAVGTSNAGHVYFAANPLVVPPSLCFFRHGKQHLPRGARAREEPGG